MADGVQVVGLKEVQLKLSKAEHAIAKNAVLMGQIGSYLKLAIGKRTAEGVDADAKPFPPYNPQYAERRVAAGRPVAHVDLFFSGSMFSALTYTANDDGVSLFFLNTTDRYGMGNPDKAFYNQQLRNFFSISAKEVAEVEDMVRDYIAQHTQG